MAALDLLPYLAAGLLVIAGASKVRRPDSMRDVLAEIGLRSTWAPMLLGVAEITLGAAALVLGGFVLWGVITAFYLAFAALLGLLVRNEADLSCGCFGESSAPIGVRQVLADLLTSVFAAVGVFAATPGLVVDGRSGVITGLLVGGVAIGVPALRHLHSG
ncbi:MAG: hypothetical protein R2704_15345 [Microthrixaceae bacterium]|nr:hypothetical protein [Microthrixaceae bacterium]